MCSIPNYTSGVKGSFWDLPKLKFQAGKKLIFPDGTLIDDYNL